MSNYIVQGETLTALGDAIRAKTGNSQLLTLADMTTVVNSDLRPMGFPDKMDLVYPNISLNSYALSTAIFGDGIWFTGAGNDVYISYDGFTWSHFTVDVSLGYVARAYANGVWVNGDTETGALYYSTDRCRTWTKCTIGTTKNINSVQHCNGHWYARCASESKTYHSIDGKNFEAMTFTSVTGNVYYTNGVYMVGDVYGADFAVYKSTDGVSFTKITNFPSEITHPSLQTYFNGIWIVRDVMSKAVCYSTDGGSTWSMFSEISSINSISSFGGKAIMIHGNGLNFSISEDGLVWENITSNLPIDTSITKISEFSASDNMLIIITDSNVFYYTLDLNTWYSKTIPDDFTSLIDVIYGGNTVMLNMLTSSKARNIMCAKIV